LRIREVVRTTPFWIDTIDLRCEDWHGTAAAQLTSAGLYANKASFLDALKLSRAASTELQHSGAKSDLPPRHSACFRLSVGPPEKTRGRVIRADTPPRHPTDPEGREVLWMLLREGAAPARAELVGLIDGVELEMFSGARFRRRWRFLRDVVARTYAERVRARLLARGFNDRRARERPSIWVE
jgi:hypothetical protein